MNYYFSFVFTLNIFNLTLISIFYYNAFLFFSSFVTTLTTVLNPCHLCATTTNRFLCFGKFTLYFHPLRWEIQLYQSTLIWPAFFFSIFNTNI